MAGAVRIGTSGWYYLHWRGPFYPEDLPAAEMLAFYLHYFHTVEINNRFYRLPSESALEGWRDVTPRGFCFAVKGSRYLTHMKKLKDPAPGLANFLPRIEILGEKLGPILFQLPPFWDCNPERLEGFLAALPRGHLYSFELRHPGWHHERIFDLLRRHNAAFCIYDLEGFQPGIVLTANFTYVRLHGPAGAYQGSYDRRTLQSWASRIREWKEQLREVFVYFDNDEAAYAARNALELKSLVE